MRYGNYQVTNKFKLDDNVSKLPEIPAYSVAYDVDPGTKRHSSCDECRKRKLKCSGEAAGCSRCTKQSLACQYSPQKQMGRPRKRQKANEDAEEAVEDSRAKRRSVGKLPKDNDRAVFESICNPPFSEHIMRSTHSGMAMPGLSSDLGSGISSGASELTPPTASPPTPSLTFPHTSYPTDLHLWPDYSTMTSLPMPVQEANEYQLPDEYAQPHQTLSAFNSCQTLPSAPVCPCLPNLYLTLSTLSTLASFPVSSHSIETLQTSLRTAKDVIYCAVCPLDFQSGMQNVMLLGTLLSVIGDAWHRVRSACGEDIRRGFGASKPGPNTQKPLDAHQSLEWRTFAHDLVLAHVFGETLIPIVPDTFPPVDPLLEEHRIIMPPEALSNCPFARAGVTNPPRPARSRTAPLPLITLVEAFDRRQREWHEMLPEGGEFPPHMVASEVQSYMRGMNLEQIREMEAEKQDHMCLKIVNIARNVIMALKRPAPTL